MRSYWPILLLVTVSLVGMSQTQDVLVDTVYGQVRGVRKEYNLEVYDEFRGIPFAEPPLGALRWQKPQPVIPWEGVLNATEFSQHCTHFASPAYILIGIPGPSGEDCLYLNIIVPRGVAENAATPLPVMVWIYGGAFILGTGAMYPGEALALHGDVIVVTFNYRLSTLGWLSTEDTAAPGNYGLWDIHATLTWIQENIRSFSGDPTRVTVFGQSAGGFLTSHSVISPLINPLFHNAISVSGSSTGFFGSTRQALRQAVLISDFFNCTNLLTSQHLVDCLMQVGPHALDFWGVVTPFIREQRIFNFVPVVDGELLPATPKELFEQGSGININFMTGITYDDGAGLILLNPIGLPALSTNVSNMARTNDSLIRAMKIALGLSSNSDELAIAIFDQYPEMNTEDTYTRTREACEALTDWLFGSASTWEAETRYRHVGSKPTYRYVFHHRQSFIDGYPDWVNGSHLDDVYSIFGEPFMEPYRRIFLRQDFDETDLQVSENIMNYYANFAHTGNPNTGTLLVPAQWDKFDLQQGYMEESPSFSMQYTDAEKTQLYQWWMTEFQSMVEIPPDPTFPIPDESTEEYQHLTEEEIELGVERFKAAMHQEFGETEVWPELERNIDRFVADRKAGIFDY